MKPNCFKLIILLKDRSTYELLSKASGTAVRFHARQVPPRPHHTLPLARTSKCNSETSRANDEVLLVQEHEPTTAEAVADTF
jgi:hypothetical protein